MDLSYLEDDYVKMMDLIQNTDINEFIKEHKKEMNIEAKNKRIKMNCLHYYAYAIENIDLNKFPPFDFIQYLSGYGIDINAQDYDGLTALHYSIGKSKNHIELNKALIKLNSQTEKKDNRGRTPLWNAVFYFRGESEMLQIINALLDAGASLDEKNNAGNSARDIIESRHTSILQGLNQSEWDLFFLLEDRN